jgi:hypothetical protein
MVRFTASAGDVRQNQIFKFLTIMRTKIIKK